MTVKGHEVDSDAPVDPERHPADAADPGLTAPDEGETAPIAGKARRYRGQDPAERRAQRRRRLLDAALELFGTVGYQATSVERLCSTSGVTGRHFYEEFPSREALLSAVLDDILDDCLRGVTEAVSAAPPEFTPRVKAGIGAYIRGLTDDPRRARIVALEIIGVSAEFEAHRRQLGRAFAEFFRNEARNLIAAGEPLVGDQLTLQALLAVINELTLVYLTSEEPLQVQDVIDEAVRVVPRRRALTEPLTTGSLTTGSLTTGSLTTGSFTTGSPTTGHFRRAPGEGSPAKTRNDA